MSCLSFIEINLHIYVYVYAYVCAYACICVCVVCAYDMHVHVLWFSCVAYKQMAPPIHSMSIVLFMFLT